MQNILDEFYTLEGEMLEINLGNQFQLYADYNNGDICAKISQF
jgi:hypothetical protein